ncbi:MAG: UMP kinase [Candidatus Magasanikbacteria bacterium]|nr:UMP kinase [Candidatus Magasanikbacteria bacterium]
MSEKEITVISLGGSLIAPKTGFNISFLSRFKQLIVKFLKENHRFIIVCGGGNTARLYQAAASEVGELTTEDIDWIGIHATRLNAHFIRTLFRAYAHPVVVKEYSVLDQIQWKEPILVGAGWKPGWSTDYDSVLLARQYNIRRVINLSNIAYVYDSDPRVNPQAKKIEKMSWNAFRNLVGNTWDPGDNVPFDPVASREAETLGLEVGILDGTNLKEVERAIRGELFEGTVIKD